VIPFFVHYCSWDNIEWTFAINVLAFGVDGETDTKRPDCQLGVVREGVQFSLGFRFEEFAEFTQSRPSLSRREQFIIGIVIAIAVHLHQDCVLIT
jgi:hypothetical protein